MRCHAAAPLLLLVSLLAATHAVAQPATPSGAGTGSDAGQGSLPVWTRPDSAALTRLGETARQVRKSVLIVGSPQAGHGTAFVLSTQHRLLATNAHVADLLHKGGSLKAVASETGAEYRIDAVWYHPGTVRYAGGTPDTLARAVDPSVGPVHPLCADVAVLHVVDDGKPLPEALPLAPPEAVRELFAEPIGMIGYPGHDSHFPRPGEASQATYHQGVVSRLTDFKTRAAADWRGRQFLQHTAPGWGGFSGSPLFLPSGEVIGLHNSGRWFSQSGRQAQLSHGVRIDCLWELLAYHKLDDKLPLPLDVSELNLARFAQPDPAFETYRQAVALLSEADALNDQRKFAESAAVCKQAMKLLPSYAPTYASRMRAFTNYVFNYIDRLPTDTALEQVTLAMNDANKYLELAPSDPMAPILYAKALNNVAGVENRMGRPREVYEAKRRRVLETMTQVLKTPGLSDGIKAEALTARATARGALEDERGAAADFAEAIRLHPTEAYHYENRAYYYELLGRASEASADRRKAADLRRLKTVAVAWQKLSSPEGRFDVELPPQPKRQARTLGELSYEAFVAGNRDLGLEFLAGYGDVPATVRAGVASEEELLDLMRDWAVQGSKISAEYNFLMAGFPGRELQLTSGDRMSDACVLLVGSRFYVCQVSGPTNMLILRSDVIRHMFASFALHPVPEDQRPKEPVDDGFVSREGGFRVKFATEPKESTEQVGGLLLHRFAAAHTAGAEFLVGYADLTDELRREHPDEARRVALLRELLVGEGKLRSEREIEISGRTAAEVLIDRADGAEMHARLVAAGGRVYHAAVMGPPLVLKDLAAESSAFLASFDLLADASPAAPATAAVWSEFRWPDGGFRVRLPGKPAASTAQGDALLHYEFTAVDQQQQMSFSVVYADISKAKLKQARTPEEWLDAVRDKGAGAGKLASERKFRLAGQPGRDLVIERSDGSKFLVRVLVVDKHLYQLLVSGPAEQMAFDAPPVRSFVDSFVLLPVEENE